MKHSMLFFILALAISSCQPKKSESGNTTADGFDMAHSDPAAVELADSILIAVGGRDNWNNTNFISWNSENRTLVWDKQKNRVRVEDLNDTTIYLLDLGKGDGRVQVNGKELTEKAALRERFNKGKAVWNNNMYLLAIPFRLKDAGMTLKYMGEDSVKGGVYSVLQVMVRRDDDTTQNKHTMYVDVNNKLIRYWSYFLPDGEEASLTLSLDNYQKFGKILLSSDRSDGIGPKNVRVDETLPDKVFTEF
jgi:hypothetical protein